MTKEEFIYQTLKDGTNSLKSTTFGVVGIGICKTKEKVREAMMAEVPLKKKCKITDDCYEVDYQNNKWRRIN